MQIKKHFQETLTALEKLNRHISSNIDVTLNRLDEENKCLNVLMNESVENINQSYNETSIKMNQLEVSFNLISSQFTEQFESMSSLNKDKVDGLIGMVCQLLSKRLSPLETLHETLNKKFILSREHISKIQAIEADLAKISERKFNKPNVGFRACKMIYFKLGSILIDKYDDVPTNYGIHFNQSSGKFTAPLNGFYLIIIHSKGIEELNGSFSVKCIQKMKNPSPLLGDSRDLCCVSNKASETLLFELTAGDILELEAVTQGNKLSGYSTIEFACCLIK
ncbi:unnamed protein product [Lymnaea stagnalis]|uniref:C1q domain-containing protein n=1 Tax=Lymnaea stagnalis TaxID=6523 RepID=A0AAV2IHB7_LYMST